jgi:LacI family transcriptional regulator
MSKITITEIAQLAGVSTGTVSRVLNGRPGVKTATRDVVLRVVGEHNFVPDAGARRLARGRRQLVGVAPFSDLSWFSPYYSLLIDAIQDELLNSGFSARILNPLGTDNSLRDCAGFIVPGVHLDDSRLRGLESRNIPLVIINEVPTAHSWVDIDNNGGICQAMQHLERLGHRHIAHLTGSPIGKTTQLRLDAYRQYLHHTIRDLPSLVLDGRFSALEAYRAVRQAFHHKLSFTAILAASDEMALGAIRALEDSGLHVPLDVSVVGFDDLPFVAHNNPALTTIRQPIRDVGATAAQLLLERLDGLDRRSVVLPTELVVRASTATAPTRFYHEK